MSEIFGAELGGTLRFIAAFLIVLGLIGATFFALKRFGGGNVVATVTGRGRVPRLAVLDQATVDARRRLVLVRRDNVEHLLLIGGPSDVVVEAGILRSALARETAPQAARETAPPRAEAEPEPQAAPRAEPPAPRPAAESAPSVLPTPPLMPEFPPRRSESFEFPRPAADNSGLRRPSLLGRAELDEAAGMAGPRPTPKPAPAIDDIASRLEQALRKPGAEAKPIPLRAPDEPPAPASAPPSAVIIPAPMTPVPPTVVPAPAPVPAPTPVPPAAAAAAPRPPEPAAPAPKGPRSVFDNLEDEMANLLGRAPTRKS